jgi:hypothetical protein
MLLMLLLVLLLLELMILLTAPCRGALAHSD